jgi:hypothetical protein
LQSPEKFRVVASATPSSENRWKGFRARFSGAAILPKVSTFVHRSACKIWIRLALAVAGLAPALSASAQDGASLSGEYRCEYGCRLTDANPGLEIRGDNAACTNEYGGLYRGRLFADGSLHCFNKVGRPQPDGRTIRWDDGMIWTRIDRGVR